MVSRQNLFDMVNLKKLKKQISKYKVLPDLRETNNPLSKEELEVKKIVEPLKVLPLPPPYFETVPFNDAVKKLVDKQILLEKAFIKSRIERHKNCPHCRRKSVEDSLPSTDLI